MRFRRTLPLLLGVLLAIPGTPAIAGVVLKPSASVNVTLGDCAMNGEAQLITTDTLVIKHRSASGALRTTHTLDVSSGDWQVDCPGPRVRPGDKLQFFREGSSSPFRVFSVPALTLRTNRVLDRVSGKAPGVGSVDLLLTLCDVAQFGCTAFAVQDVPVDPGTKTWSHTSTENLRGGSRVAVAWAKGNDRVVRNQDVAQLIARPGSAVITGKGRTSGLRERVTLRRGNQTSTSRPLTRADASFTATMRRNGAKRAVRKGDIVTSSIAGDASLTVPATSIDLIAGGVEGTCFKERPVTVLYRSLGGGVFMGHLRTTDANGRWEVLDPAPPGTRIEAWCATAAGDAVVRSLVTD